MDKEEWNTIKEKLWERHEKKEWTRLEIHMHYDFKIVENHAKSTIKNKLNYRRMFFIHPEQIDFLFRTISDIKTKNDIKKIEKFFDEYGNYVSWFSLESW